MDGNTAYNTPPDPYNCLLNTTLLLTSCTVQSMSVQDFLAKHVVGFKLPKSFENLVTDMIESELPNWETDFCFLYFYCVEKVYITISDTYSDILQHIVKKRKRVYLEALGLTPFKPQTQTKDTKGKEAPQVDPEKGKQASKDDGEQGKEASKADTQEKKAPKVDGGQGNDETDKGTYKVTVRYPSSINLSSFIKTPYILF